MPRVKLVWTEYDYDYSDKMVMRDIQDWEDISEEDFQTLRYNLYKLTHPNGYSAHLVVQDDVPIAARLQTIKERLAKLAAEEEARKRKLMETKEDKKKKREAQEKATYEKLRSKFEKDKKNGI